MNAWGQIVDAFAKPAKPKRKVKLAATDKQCTHCGVVKSRTEFYKRVDHSPGAIMSHCKACFALAQAKRREYARTAAKNLKARQERLSAIPAAKFVWPDDE